ncbi:putative leucine-rich repeat receptor-like protein kinase At1g68400 [Bidens hawaiensis]|uniref:putative leucine-rich repeat receptor-like protein kinase At1g68400 n=1 Tax=Bidens hawaiensis TaxID=980011 RepID=UPI00404A72CE
MHTPPHYSTLFLLFIHLSVLHAAHPDLPALLAFKSLSDISHKLLSWTNTNSSNPCQHFLGVSCHHNRVTGLVLENLNLQGPFDSLALLVKLRVLSLKHNQLNGHVPNLSNLTHLRLLFLSHNHLSGEFPPMLPSLFRLDLSYNNISGNIPDTVNRLTLLLTLRLEGNHISGSIEFLKLPNLRDFNISMNNVSGKIPDSLSGFPESVFRNNFVLCGFPVMECAQPKMPSPASPVVSATPSALSSTADVPRKKSGNSHSGGKISTLAIIGIIIGDVLVLALVSLLLYCYFSGESSDEKNNGQKSEKLVYPSSTGSSFEKGKMVFFDGTRQFELEDLLRASAEMLGKGGLGTAYKALLDDGNVVAVKRLKEVAIGGKREFEQLMEVLGRLRHPNIVSLKAYYFAKDEKLLVYEYMTNGNLFWLLHGNRGPGRTPLDWSTRLKIVAGAARGLAFIHTSNSSLKLTHGNIKSTNILLDKSGNACISDVGHSAITPLTGAPRSVGYRAPELLSTNNRKSTQKSDVYSFGVLLMEVLTGKCPALDNSGVLDLPRWVRSVVREEWTAELFDLELMRYKDIEEEIVALLNIALACTSNAPDQRPTMDDVVKMIHDIEGVEVSLSRDTVNSASHSP